MIYDTFLGVCHIAESLADNMGQKFGGAHIDKLDSPGHYTNMVALSDLPPRCDPGRFYIVYPGVFVTLDNCVSINFSGLRVHGGSPPIAAEGTTEEELEWGARFIGVEYAKTGPTGPEHKMPLMQLEPDSILSISPELLRPGCVLLDVSIHCTSTLICLFRDFNLKKKFNVATFVTEGPTIMSPSSIMGFLVRCLLLLAVTMMSQLPSGMDVRIDSDAFVGSLSFVDRDGSRKRLSSWADGPGWRRTDAETKFVEAAVEFDGHNDLVDQREHTALMRKRWNAHQQKYGGHIPSVVCCVAGYHPLEGWTEGDPIKKIQPLKFEHEKNRNKKPRKNKGKGKVPSEWETSEDGMWAITTYSPSLFHYSFVYLM